MDKEWFIYSLLDVDGILFYVGFTRSPRRRLTEHKATFGRSITMEILQRGIGSQREWAPAERHWITEMKARGFILKNLSNGGSGAGTATEETREKLRKASTGRVVKWAEKISRSQKGVPKMWSPDGLKRVRSTRFKKGEPRNLEIEAKRKEAQQTYMKHFWNSMTPESREDFLRRRGEKVSAGMAAKKIDDVDSLTTKEAASELNVTQHTVYMWIKAGFLQVVRLGGQMRVPKSCIENVKVGRQERRVSSSHERNNTMATNVMELSPSSLCIMDESGDTRMQWDRTKPEEVSKAESRFKELRAKGYLAYKVNKKGDQGEVINAFDPEAERIIMHSQLIGG